VGRGLRGKGPREEHTGTERLGALAIRRQQPPGDGRSYLSVYTSELVSSSHLAASILARRTWCSP
jgi:hypothetical protein